MKKLEKNIIIEDKAFDLAEEFDANSTKVEKKLKNYFRDESNPSNIQEQLEEMDWDFIFGEKCEFGFYYTTMWGEDVGRNY